VRVSRSFWGSVKREELVRSFERSGDDAVQRRKRVRIAMPRVQ